jgi:hypothetical protein
MSFLGVCVGSQGFKNMNEFLKFLMKVEQCSIFEGKKVMLARWFFLDFG